MSAFSLHNPAEQYAQQWSKSAYVPATHSGVAGLWTQLLQIHVALVVLCAQFPSKQKTMQEFWSG